MYRTIPTFHSLACLAILTACLAGCDGGGSGDGHAHHDHDHDHHHGHHHAHGHDEGPVRGQVGDDGKPVIAVSIFPVAELVRSVTGESAHVHTLLSPGASPHGFELPAQRVAQLSKAHVVVSVGMGVDPWAKKAADRVGNDQQVRTSAAALLNIKPSAETDHHDHGHADHGDHGHHHGHDHSHAGAEAHFWLDPVMADQFVAALADRLSKAYPDQAEQFQDGAKAMGDQLQALDRAYKQQLAEAPRKELVTFHNAFDGLAQRYGLKVVAHLTEIELAPGSEVSPRQLVQAIEAIKKHQLAVIYAEPQFPEQAVKALRDQTGVEVLRLDPIGHPEVESVATYVKMMKANLATLVDGQSRGN